MAIFSLDVRRARKGDCLILHYGTKAKPGLALIDGGPAQVYGPQLKPRLAQIRKARGLGADATLPVDLLMVSHIDDDHINGILELTKEMVTAADAKQPLPVKVTSFWHNTFDDIIGNVPKELKAAVTAQFGPASLAGAPDIEGLNEAAAKVLASVDQGFRLRDDARKLKLRVNPQFGGGLVMAKKGADKVKMSKGLTFTVAGPLEPELKALQKAHDDFLIKKKAGDVPKDALSAFTDTSVPNLSSLVLLAEAGKKRMLLTGDARGDKILKGLEQVGLLEPEGTMHVDLFKVPHHGSSRNMKTEVFQRVTADHYVFSGNGEHGNPDRETLEMLLEARGDADYLVHLTYPVEEIDAEREKEWKKRKKEKWSAKNHSIKAFLSANKSFAGKVRIVEEGKPHVIDLLDKITF